MVRKKNPENSQQKKIKDSFEIAFYEKILEENPNFVEAMKVLAELYTKNKEYEKGLKLDQKLSKLLPNNEIVYYNLACSYSLLGKIDKAFEALKKAILLGYVDFDYFFKDPDLENLRKDPRFKEILLLAKR